MHGYTPEQISGILASIQAKREKLIENAISCGWSDMDNVYRALDSTHADTLYWLGRLARKMDADSAPDNAIEVWA